MIEYCCEEMRDTVELGWIKHDDKHVILVDDRWAVGVIFYVSFFPNDYGEFKLSFCPFCGVKL